MKLKSKILVVLFVQIVLTMGLFTNYTVFASSSLWYRTWGGSADDAGTAIAIAADGSIYCAGTTESFGKGMSDFALVKYFPNGTKAWNITWGSTNADTLNDMVLNATGYIYCIGKLGNNQTIAVFSPSGLPIWNITGGYSPSDKWNGIFVDSQGSIYCTGQIYNATQASTDLLLMKFYSNKTKAWQSSWDCQAGADEGNKLTMDDKGALYCIGEVWNPSSLSTDMALTKFYPNGTRAWSTIWAAPYTQYGKDVAFGLDDAIYCAGETGTMRDLRLSKVYTNGTADWNITWGGSGHDTALSVNIDPFGNIVCAGYTSSFGAGGSDFLLVKYNYFGWQIWYSTWGTTDTEFAYDLAINNTDGSFVCVGTKGPYGSYDFLTVTFTSSGQGPTESGGGVPGFEILSAIFTLSIIVLVLKRTKSPNL
jgi:hypothetical protein